MSNIDPTREQFEAFKESCLATHPIMMLNLIALHDKARYDGWTEKRRASEAYAAYGQESRVRSLPTSGGSILWRGKPECCLNRPMRPNTGMSRSSLSILTLKLF